jgi:chitinase
MSFSSYVTTWDQNPQDQVNQMIAAGVLKENTRVILAFASFNFSGTDYIPGLGNMSLEDCISLTTMVHSHGAKISLSIGGATYPLAGSDLYSRPEDLAGNINTMIIKSGFDGVDFDIEDSSSSVPSNFAITAASLINTLRSLNSALYISLTTAAQAWVQGNYQQSLLNLTFGNINAWQPMEYDLWISPSVTYYAQICFDIMYYINTWHVSPSKIILGLMPGTDDQGKNLALVDALNLTLFAKSTGLQGVMIWDSNRDSKGCDGNAPYAYSLGIQGALASQSSRVFFESSKVQRCPMRVYLEMFTYGISKIRNLLTGNAM